MFCDTKSKEDEDQNLVYEESADSLIEDSDGDHFSKSELRNIMVRELSRVCKSVALLEGACKDYTYVVEVSENRNFLLKMHHRDYDRYVHMTLCCSDPLNYLNFGSPKNTLLLNKQSAGNNEPGVDGRSFPNDYQSFSINSKGLKCDPMTDTKKLETSAALPVVHEAKYNEENQSISAKPTQFDSGQERTNNENSSSHYSANNDAVMASSVSMRTAKVCINDAAQNNPISCDKNKMSGSYKSFVKGINSKNCVSDFVSQSTEKLNLDYSTKSTKTEADFNVKNMESVGEPTSNCFGSKTVVTQMKTETNFIGFCEAWTELAGSDLKNARNSPENSLSSIEQKVDDACSGESSHIREKSSEIDSYNKEKDNLVCSSDEFGCYDQLTWPVEKAPEQQKDYCNRESCEQKTNQKATAGHRSEDYDSYDDGIEFISDESDSPVPAGATLSGVDAPKGTITGIDELPTHGLQVIDSERKYRCRRTCRVDLRNRFNEISAIKDHDVSNTTDSNNNGTEIVGLNAERGSGFKCAELIGVSSTVFPTIMRDHTMENGAQKTGAIVTSDALVSSNTSINRIFSGLKNELNILFDKANEHLFMLMQGLDNEIARHSDRTDILKSQIDRINEQSKEA